MNIREKLDRLYGLRLERASMLIDTIPRITVLEAEIDKIKQEGRERTAAIDEAISIVEQEIVGEVLELQQTIAGQFLQAIYTKGRRTLDAEAIKATRPDIYDTFTKVGQPSVRIAEKKRG